LVKSKEFFILNYICCIFSNTDFILHVMQTYSSPVREETKRGLAGKMGKVPKVDISIEINGTIM
jgi:hypothetical protein